MFRTKARAPSLIVCEVLREDLNAARLHNIKMASEGTPVSPTSCDSYATDNGTYRMNRSGSSNFNSVDEGDVRGGGGGTAGAGRDSLRSAW